jgi:CO/xanthine dehydrogenase Mo-binding subunit
VQSGEADGLADAFAEASTMALTLDDDGGFTLSASLHDPGCGVVTVMRVIVAEVMGVSPDLVRCGEADTDHTPYDFGTFGSRATYVCGACARAVASELRGQMLWAAAVVLGSPVDRIVADNGEVRVGGEHDRRLRYADLAAAARVSGGLAASTQYFASSNPASYSVQFAEVEVDTFTGLVRVTDMLAAVDIGQAINTGMVEGQVQGAVQMGIGYALCEDLQVDERGRCAIGGFKEYHIVNAPDMPDVRVLLVQHEGDDGPFGAKSVGEIAVVPTAAAVVNAVNHALDTSLSDLPLTPEKILAALDDGAV